ncbi:MAG: putative addiction module antidote protein [Elusimicrobia bacterium]|nr:putative addiction module antidote protein [Elusimicrobiota bacterium]
MKGLGEYEAGLLDRLSDPAYAVGYLNAVLESGDPGDFLAAVGDVARAHGGLGALARRVGLDRVHLFRMLAKGGNPELRSLSRVVGALGFTLRVAPR